MKWTSGKSEDLEATETSVLVLTRRGIFTFLEYFTVSCGKQACLLYGKVVLW